MKERFTEDVTASTPLHGPGHCPPLTPNIVVVPRLNVTDSMSGGHISLSSLVAQFLDGYAVHAFDELRGVFSPMHRTTIAVNSTALVVERHASLGLSVKTQLRQPTTQCLSAPALQPTKNCLPISPFRQVADESLLPDQGRGLDGHIVSQEESLTAQMFHHRMF